MADIDHAARKERMRKIVRSLVGADPPPQLPPDAYSRAAIVTTVKNIAPQTLATWCNYHLAAGFERLFIYFDDRDECAPFDDERIICIPVDDDLSIAWSRLGPPALEWLPHAEVEVQARQALNALHALSACVADGSIAWLLHIDADELFYPPTGTDVSSHFKQLGAAGVQALTYANLEALPERDHERCTTSSSTTTSIPFADVTLFKTNPNCSKAAASGSGSGNSSGGSSGSSSFNYYTNGKSVVRVAPRARPLSVHEWIPGSADGLSRWYSALGASDLVKPWLDAAPVILHYACCSSQALWLRRCGGADRYRLRGVVSAPSIYVKTALASGGRKAADCIPEEEELVAVVEEEEEEGGGEEEDAEERRRVEEVFQLSVMLADLKEAERRVASGMCVRVERANLGAHQT